MGADFKNNAGGKWDFKWVLTSRNNAGGKWDFKLVLTLRIMLVVNEILNGY